MSQLRLIKHKWWHYFFEYNCGIQYRFVKRWYGTEVQYQKVACSICKTPSHLAWPCNSILRAGEEMKYRKKPVVIEAVKWNGTNLDELRRFVPDEFRDNRINQPMGLITLEGVLTISEGDYIIKGVKGEFYPCKPDIFEMTYEAVVPREHVESHDCWCGPELVGDYEADGGTKHYVHRETQ